MKDRATFNDFLYAITVGSAISIAKDYSFGLSLAGVVVLLMIVLEDFFTYKTIVASEDPSGTHYTLKSLYVELAILFTWFAAFYLWVDAKYDKSILWLFLFWGIKGLAGLDYYRKARELGTLKALIDVVNLIPIFILGVNWYVGGYNLAELPVAFGWMCGGWLVAYGTFRFLRMYA